MCLSLFSLSFAFCPYGKQLPASHKTCCQSCTYREVHNQIQDVNIARFWVGHTPCGRSKRGKHPVGVPSTGQRLQYWFSGWWLSWSSPAQSTLRCSSMGDGFPLQRQLWAPARGWEWQSALHWQVGSDQCCQKRFGLTWLCKFPQSCLQHIQLIKINSE